MAFVVLFLCLSSAVTQVDPVDVRKAVDQFFIEAGNDRCAAYAERLTQAIARAPSDAWRRRLVEELPGAAQYHASTVEFYKTRSRQFQIPADLLVKGYDTQIDQLEARVARAARNERTPEVRAQTEAQIRSLFDGARERVKATLQGDVSSAYVDRQLNQVRDAWIGSLDKVYNTLLDGPLAAGDYESVLSDIRTRTGKVTPVVLTVEDLRDPNRLKELGIAGLMEDVQAALMRAPKLRFSDYDPALVARQKKWVDEVDAWQAKSVKEKNEAARAAAREAVPPSLPSPPSEVASSPPPAAPPPKAVSAPRATSAPPSPPVEAGGSRRWIAVLVTVVVAGLVVALTAFRRRPSGAA